MVPNIRMVASNDAPPAPYPSEVRAKGWTFELDYERLEQSDTWVLASPEMRPWLLMVWLTAWRQSPCGSLPNSDELIAARIGMPVRQFAAHRDILMRGWVLHADGRLYHPVITELVMKMLGKREIEAARKRGWREKKQGLTSDVPRDTGGTPVGATLPPPPPVISKTSSSHPPRPARGAGKFDEFWLAWPKNERKQDKAKCRDYWQRNGLDALADTILADVRTKRGTRKWREGFVEAPLVYLRGSRWDDGVTPDGDRPADAVADWHETRSGIESKGEEVGVGRWDEYAASVGQGPSWPEYRRKVFTAAGFEGRRA